MKINSILGEKILYDWTKLVDLQPENVKVPYNYEYLKKSILKYGFALAFAGWENDGKIYTIDGHTRKQILLELINDGYEIPNELEVQLINADNRQNAIEILTEVYNQKHNPFDGDVFSEWLLTENVEIDNNSVNVDWSVEDDIDFDNIEANNNRSLKDKSKEVTCDRCGHNFFV